jgi:hypothetical protein
MLKSPPSRFQNNGTSVAGTRLVTTHKANTDAVPVGTRNTRPQATATARRPIRSVGTAEDRAPENG